MELEKDFAGELKSVKRLLEKYDCFWAFWYKGRLYGSGVSDVTDINEISKVMEKLGIQAKETAQEIATGVEIQPGVWVESNPHPFETDDWLLMSKECFCNEMERINQDTEDEEGEAE